MKEVPDSINIINDVSAGNYNHEILHIASEHVLPYVLLHSKGTPVNMDSKCHYNDVIKEITMFFKEKIEKLLELGIPRWNIILDPGLGFSKNIEQNEEILKKIQEIKKLKFPLLIGFSNKRLVKNNFGEDLSIGNSSMATVSVEKGVDIIRIHEKEIVKAIRFADKMYKNTEKT